MEVDKIKIGVFGSADGVDPNIASLTYRLGLALAKFDPSPILITGACPGIPYQVALAARQAGLREIWGFSPATDYEGQQRFSPNEDNGIYSDLIYVPSPIEMPHLEEPSVAKKFRNVASTAACDAGIIVAGRHGSLNEFTNLYDMGRVIGVLSGSGGVADLLPLIQDEIKKPSQAVIHFNSSPEQLATLVFSEVQMRRHR